MDEWDNKSARVIARKANKHSRDGLSVNDAVLLAFTDYDLDLPLVSTDAQGKPEWVG